MADCLYSEMPDADLIVRLAVFAGGEEPGQPEEEFWKLRSELIARLKDDTDRLQAALGHVLRSVSEADSEAYWAAISAGRSSAPKPMFEACAGWVKHQETFWRRVGVDILAQLGDNRPMRDASVPIIVGCLRDKAERVVASALYALGHLNLEAPLYDDATLILLNDLVASPTAEIRRAAVSALSAEKFPAGIPGLIVLSRDVVSDIRDWATFGLGTISALDTAGLRDALVARLDDEDEDTKQEAMVGLALRKDGRAIPTIRCELEEGRVSKILVEAIEALPDPNYIPLLESYLVANPNDADVASALAACRNAAPVG